MLIIMLLTLQNLDLIERILLYILNKLFSYLMNWSYEVNDSNAEKWGCWTLNFKPEKAGTYKMSVKAKNAEGSETLLSATVEFTVE